MKKKVLFILTFLLLAGLVACGKAGQPPEADTAEVKTIELQLDYDEDAQVTGCIKAFSADGSLVWEYVTNRCYPGQCDVIEEIGLSPAGYIFLEEGSVYCLDRETGEVLWVNEDFGGTGASWSFDDADNLYLTGYFAPWLFCVDSHGKTLVDYEAMPEEYDDQGFYWSADLFVDGDGMVHIHYLGNDMIMLVDPANGEVLDTYSYTEALDAECPTGE